MRRPETISLISIMDIKEMVSGQRMMATYFRPGGLWRDTPVEFEIAVRRFLRMFPPRIKQYEALLTKNPIFMDRTRNIGKLSAEDAINRSEEHTSELQSHL